jgi:hypothetical protein
MVPTRRTASAALSALVITAGIVAAIQLVPGSRPTASSSARPIRAAAPAASTPPAASTTSSATASRKPASPKTATAKPAKTSAARQRLARLVAEYSKTSTSVAAYDLATGATVTAGAASGMVTASVVKVQLLETLLLKHQLAGTVLSADETATVTAMIENSSNDAAETTFWDIGGRDAVVDAEARLGLSPSKTVPGSDDYWGLTLTSARQQLVLLENLVTARSPLSRANRSFALSLLRDVEADQRWGVPVVADADTSPAVKNGWLSVTDDGDLWTVNSSGVVTVDGHLLLISVMTQHDASMSAGVTLVERLTRLAARTLTS